MKNSDIHLRDPFILVHEGKYYLYGTRGEGCWDTCSGFDVYIGDDLENWSDPISVFEAEDSFWGKHQFWAPEVHYYNGKFYMFASFKADGHRRATHILVSDRPDELFTPLAPIPVTPPEWDCLDGTLYVDDTETPYLIFCHEWTQIGDGTIDVVKLKADLSGVDSDVQTLFSASSHPLNVFIDDVNNGHGCVTDGPFLFQKQDGTLLMLWSSHSREGRYQQILSESLSGKITGPWRHLSVPLFDEDGGHGMLFTDLDGNLRLSLHQYNQHPFERPRFIPVSETPDGLRVVT